MLNFTLMFLNKYSLIKHQLEKGLKKKARHLQLLSYIEI